MNSIQLENKYGTTTITGNKGRFSICNTPHLNNLDGMTVNIDDNFDAIDDLDASVSGDVAEVLLAYKNNIELNTVFNEDVYTLYDGSRSSVRDLIFPQLTVEIGGKVFDADEQTRGRIADHLTILSGKVDDTFTLNWILANNEETPLNLDGLRELGVAVVTKHSELWAMSREELIDIALSMGLIDIPGYSPPPPPVPEGGYVDSEAYVEPEE